MTYRDEPFTLTDGDHYFVLMADHKYNDESDLVEYSGIHHATIDSARMELAYAQGDDWGDHIKSIEIKEDNMEELTNFSELKKFIELKPFEPKEPFNGFIVIPQMDTELHDSGYCMLKIALTNHGRVVGCVEGCTDVIHLNGIGGYGKFNDKYEDRVRTRTAPAIDWSIDVTPNGLVRVFCSHELEMSEFPLSDLPIYLKED